MVVSIATDRFQIVDLLVAPIYLILSVAALASPFLSSLSHLALHGKTRLKSSGVGSFTAQSTARPQQHQQQQLRNYHQQQPQRKQQQPLQLLKLWNVYYQQLLHGDVFLVEKRYFCHFYVVGFCGTCIGCYCWLCGPWLLIEGKHRHFPKYHFIHLVRIMAIVLLLLHLIRRWYECVHVHQWAKSSSRMHIVGYLVGVIHYLLLPFVFFGSITQEHVDNLKLQHFGGYTTTYLLVATAAATFNIWAQYQQHIHHVILASLRSTTSNPISTNKKAHERANHQQQQRHQHADFVEYSIPNGRWFRFVTCPHYFAEILIYISFAILLELSSTASTTTTIERSTSLGATTTRSSFWVTSPTRMLSLLQQLRLYRPWILCIWVITNLAVSARSNHIWYLEHFSNYQSLHRAKLFPFVW